MSSPIAKLPSAVGRNRPVATRLPIFVAALGLGLAPFPNALLAAVAPMLSIVSHSGAPSLVNGSVRAGENEEVVLDVSVSNPSAPGNALSLSVRPLTPNSSDPFPPGAMLTENQRGSWTYRWTAPAGAEDAYPHTVLTFIAADTVTGKLAKSKVAVLVHDALPPVFLSPTSTLDAVVNQTMAEKIVVRPDDANDKVRIRATGLPKGAKLGKARKNPTTGNWEAWLKWKPTVAQQDAGNGNPYAVNLIADDYTRWDLISAQFGLTLNVLPPSVSGITVTQATATDKGAYWILSVQGSVQSDTGLPTGLKVDLDFGDGMTPISYDPRPILVNAAGAWTYEGRIDPYAGAPKDGAGKPTVANLPCSVKATLTYGGSPYNHALTVNRSGALPPTVVTQCVDTPQCTGVKRWWEWGSMGGMAAMCM